MNSKLLIFLSLIIFNLLPHAYAHTVKISRDVGGTIHIEPNDNPRAGEPADTWFALTRKGGKILPLKDCECLLAVYAEPHTPGEPALLEPSLRPIQAERYEGIPGATITFPKPGIYELQLSGKPISAGSFEPFKLKFQVTVAAGKSLANPPTIENQIDAHRKKELSYLLQPIIIGAILLLSVGMIAFLVQTLRRSNL